MKQKLWLLAALVISVTMWAAPAFAQDMGDSYLPLDYYRDNVDVAADEENFYWVMYEQGDGWEYGREVLWQAPRQGGEPKRLYEAVHIYSLAYADGNLYFIANGKLIKYDVAAGESITLAASALAPVVYQGNIYYLKLISDWHRQLCRQPAGGGSEEMLADYATRYWFSEGRICYTQGNTGYVPDAWLPINNVGSLPLAGGKPDKGYYTYAFAWADGWYYCLDEVSVKEKNVESASFGTEQGKLYRWRWQNGQREYEQILLLPQGSRFDTVQLVDGTFYYTMKTQMAHGHATSGLYAYDVEADGLPRQLTDCKVADFYVFGDQAVHKEPWYGPAVPQWQVLNLAK